MIVWVPDSATAVPTIAPIFTELAVKPAPDKLGGDENVFVPAIVWDVVKSHIPPDTAATGIVPEVMEAPDITGGDENVLTPAIVWAPVKLHLESKAVWALALKVEMYPKVVEETPFKFVIYLQ